MPPAALTTTAATLALQVGLGLGGKSALIIVDVQDCFLEAATTSGNPGSLSVPASQIIPLINSIRTNKSCLFDKVVRTQDFHPPNHISFGSTHGLAPFSGAIPVMCITPSSGLTADGACCPTIVVNPSAVNCSTDLCPPDSWNYTIDKPEIIEGNLACTECASNPGSCFATTQSMWTDHCLQDGDSTFPPTLEKSESDMIVQKGMNQYVDAYSAFMDNTQTLKTNLHATLQAEGIDTIYVAGIATDVCVRWTVMDALTGDAGSSYTVKVIRDATAAVLGNEANFNASMDAMETGGATILTTADVLAMDCPSADNDPVNTVNGGHRGASAGLLLPGLLLGCATLVRAAARPAWSD